LKREQIVVDPEVYRRHRLSAGFRVGELLFVSGQAGTDTAGEVVGVGDFSAQAEQALRNLKRVLEAGGSTLAHVAKVTIFLTDMANLEHVVGLRSKWFAPPYPAEMIVEVQALYRPEVVFEIEAIAIAAEGQPQPR
jgi:2-iminobutanoate/2-iminopropanoate deaminase